MSLTSKLSVKAQTVIPLEIREALGLQPGDRVRYTRTQRGILIDRAPTGPEEDPFAAFGDWASPEEDHAWKDL